MLKWIEVEKRKQCVTCTWTQTDHEATECHLTNCTGSTLDPTKFNHWQLQNVLRNYVGRNFGWHRPNYKMSLGKITIAIPIFSYFLTSDALDFVVLILNYFLSQKRLCSVFCSCKKRYHGLNFVVAHRMHCVLYLSKAFAQLLPLIWTLIQFLVSPGSKPSHEWGAPHGDRTQLWGAAFGSNFGEQLSGATLENSFGEPLWGTGLKHSRFGATTLQR